MDRCSKEVSVFEWQVDSILLCGVCSPLRHRMISDLMTAEFATGPRNENTWSFILRKDLSANLRLTSSPLEPVDVDVEITFYLKNCFRTARKGRISVTVGLFNNDVMLIPPRNHERLGCDLYTNIHEENFKVTCKLINLTTPDHDTAIVCFDNLLANGMDKNIVLLHVVGTEFRVHKQILAHSSPIFRSQIENMPEGENHIAIFDNHTPETVKQMLLCMYLGKINETGLTIDKAKELLDIAEAYKVQTLKDICIRVVGEKLNVKNIFQAQAVSEVFKSKCLLMRVNKFIAENTNAIIGTEQEGVIDSYYRMLKHNSLRSEVHNSCNNRVSSTFANMLNRDSELF